MRTSLRLTVVAVVALAGLLGSAGAAQAHVTVSTSTSEPGAYTTLIFKVPNESDTASTTGLTVTLPKDTPFTSVLTQKAPGWTVAASATDVTWTATDGGIGPGEFATFALAVGPLPDSGTVTLPAVQKYSDGTEVAWVQQSEGTAEAEHPAPQISVGAAAGEAAHTDHDADAADAPAGGSGGWGVGLGVTGIVLALLAGLGAGVALGRTRRGTPPADPAPRRDEAATAAAP